MLSQLTAAANQQRESKAVRHSSTRLWAIGLLLVGYALRLYKLGGESLWYDETVSVYLAAQPITELVAHTARDIHPPAYYLLLYLWRWLSNPTVAFGLEYLYAWPSLCLDILVMALTYAIAKRCFGLNTAQWALALALLHPPQIWFAQEVRMYSLGAFSLMLTLWSVSPFFTESGIPDPKTSRTTFVLYPVAALVGLYTLYYFLFWLAILNLCVVVRRWRNRQDLQEWVALQLLVVIGWLPWLPIFSRQALSPPVPAWREPWQNAAGIVSSLSEAVASLWMAHITPLSATWPWALLVVLVGIAFYAFVKSVGRQNRLAWLVLCFGPTLLLFDLSLFGPPIYHVRYVSTYAPLIVLLIAALLANIPRVIAALTFTAIVAVSLVTVVELWTSPLYRADDHRSAVATIARQWRPGDAILVNAGWAYTALSVYWPTELSSPNATRPPSPVEQVRLVPNAAKNPTSEQSISSTPVIYRSGSVDGDSNLGWGLPESDFFAISAQGTRLALAQLAANHTRIWHYRLYDTVSDPNEVIRSWLNGNTLLEYNTPIPGRDYLRLERYQTNDPIAQSPAAIRDILLPKASLSLLDYSFSGEIAAGETLYVTSSWELSQTASTAATAISLRLYDVQGDFVLQYDEPLSIHQSRSANQSLALPIPADTPPGVYFVALVVYAPDSLAPYLAQTARGSDLPFPLLIGEIEVRLPLAIPYTPWAQATFDYIDLINVELPIVPLTAEATLDSAWTWRPRPSNYRDHYQATVRYVHHASNIALRIDFDLGGPSYPSSQWPANYPVTQRVRSLLPPDLPAGIYEVQLSLTRVSDGQPIRARQQWLPWQQPSVVVGEIEIVAAQN